jgi:hypothetical protein
MASKKKKIRCWVCGVPATREAFGEHICDNPVCEQITREDITLALAMEKVKEKEEEFRRGEAV